jgi:hypothetical protein
MPEDRGQVLPRYRAKRESFTTADLDFSMGHRVMQGKMGLDHVRCTTARRQTQDGKRNQDAELLPVAWRATCSSVVKGRSETRLQKKFPSFQSTVLYPLYF